MCDMCKYTIIVLLERGKVKEEEVKEAMKTAQERIEAQNKAIEPAIKAIGEMIRVFVLADLPEEQKFGQDFPDSNRPETDRSKMN